MITIANKLGINGPSSTKDAHFICVAELAAKAAAVESISPSM